MSQPAACMMFDAVRACSIALLAGIVLHAGDVTAGNGSIVDWRTIKSGETIQEGGDAFDTAYLFVALVGQEAAYLAATRERTIEPPPPTPEPLPTITAWMRMPDGRRRTFEVGAFRVAVDPIGSDRDGDAHDKAQAAFTDALAKAASALPERRGPSAVDLAFDQALRWAESQGADR